MTWLAAPSHQGMGHSSKGRIRATWLLVAATPVLGYLATFHASYVLIAGGAVLLLGLLSTEPVWLPLIAIPATLLVFRVGGSGSNLSLSDLLLGVATLCALPLFDLRAAKEVRSLLWLLAAYQATTLLAVVDNPYTANVVEWGHEAFLVGGSLVIGWVVAQRGRSASAVAAYLTGASFIAGWSCLASLANHFRPVYLPFGMQKNYIGDMLAFAVLLAAARPEWMGARTRRWTGAVIALCLVGVLASQSKQAMLSVVAGIGVLLLRDAGLRRRSMALILSCIPLIVIAYIVVSREFASQNQYNSVHQRISWLQQSIQIWHMSPLVGIGLRWWYTNRVQSGFQPPNAEAEVLTSTGMIGLAGFVVLVLGAIWVLRNCPHRYGTLALSILTVRLVQGQLDIFWVTAQGAIPWMLIGLCLGNSERAQDAETTQSPLLHGLPVS